MGALRRDDPGTEVARLGRFGHTGELGGLTGQIVAGLACADDAALVWTGLALAFRRLVAWRRVTSRPNAKAA